ncbi:helix-hairpin-helix domain-containing protein [Fulvivirga ligni]|uniref:helix-hairpin-helix domain-containing protein n=1 Tax=Fulvivirga ligni TaxID=2904246 RepID=UPI001F351246|nr:helix-hairpin-helix domain-containing protein [Fulvivirga ligni]UII23127.1 helix-hairpin-helix domain-containing protein [Fulvivirga ligni]
MKKKLIRWARSSFGLSRVEANGIVIFLPLTLFIIMIPSIYKLLLPDVTHPNDSAKLDELIAQIEIDSSSPDIKQREWKIIPFNPNNITYAELLDFGVNKYAAKNWTNYTQKGGEFKGVSDLEKVYGIHDDELERLLPFAQFPEKVAKAPLKKEFIRPYDSGSKPEKRTYAKFDINKADSTDLKRLRGIGTAYANRIIKYRDVLGGYVNKEQLKEVYGLKSEVLQGLDTSIFISGGFDPTKLDLNKASEYDLSKHPYLRKKHASAIINYRYQHGELHSLDELYNIKLLDSLTIQKIARYVSF